ncbi:hypothetical protein, partial [Aeromonas sp. MdU4]|uniref:hypothetical protein n=1 Tax=Aeromonas sp. MdU4 TaxID=3342819 RepID=UPI0035B71F57
FALPLALSMEAHYREQILSGKGKLHVFLIKLHNRSNNKQYVCNLNQITHSGGASQPGTLLLQLM